MEDIKKTTIFIASDHAGFALKKFLIRRYPQYPWEDLGVHNEQKSHYPKQAQALCQKITSPAHTGVLICASGQGMAITANRFPQVRAALAWSKPCAQLAKEHNKANVLCLGAKLIPFEQAGQILQTFIHTPFKGGRHLERIKMINLKKTPLS